MTVKTALSMLFTATLIIALEGCCLCPWRAKVVCVDFEPPLTLGTQYGGSGHNSGDLAFTTNGVPISVYEFNFNGGSAFRVAYIEVPSLPFSSGQCIRTNNINLEFDFSQLGFQTSQVDLRFLDAGGFENLSVNGSPIFVGELRSAPASIGGVGLVVNTESFPPPSSNVKGTLILRGEVKTLRIGGQEFCIDQVCAKE